MKNSTANENEIYQKPLIKENIKKENFDELGFMTTGSKIQRILINSLHSRKVRR